MVYHSSIRIMHDLVRRQELSHKFVSPLKRGRYTNSGKNTQRAIGRTHWVFLVISVIDLLLESSVSAGRFMWSATWIGSVNLVLLVSTSSSWGR